MPIHLVINFQVSTKNYITLRGRKFERRNGYNIALCLHEHNEIKV